MKTKTEKAKKLVLYGNIKKEQGKRQEAIEYYSEAIQIDVYYSKAYFKLGTIYLEENDYNRAIPFLKAALRQNPKDAESHNNIGCCYIYKNMLDKAIDHFNQAILINPQYIRAYDNRASAYRDMGMLQKAESDEKIKKHLLYTTDIIEKKDDNNLSEANQPIENILNTKTTIELIMEG